MNELLLYCEYSSESLRSRTFCLVGDEHLAGRRNDRLADSEDGKATRWVLGLDPLLLYAGSFNLHRGDSVLLVIFVRHLASPDLLRLVSVSLLWQELDVLQIERAEDILDLDTIVLSC